MVFGLSLNCVGRNIDTVTKFQLDNFLLIANFFSRGSFFTEITFVDLFAVT